MEVCVTAKGPFSERGKRPSVFYGDPSRNSVEKKKETRGTRGGEEKAKQKAEKKDDDVTCRSPTGGSSVPAFVRVWVVQELFVFELFVVKRLVVFGNNRLSLVRYGVVAARYAGPL